MEINLKFRYRDLSEEDLETLLQQLQESAMHRNGSIYSITKIKTEEDIANKKVRDC